MAEQYVRRSELVRRMNEAADNGTSLYRAALDTPSAADVVEVQDALTFSQTFYLVEYREKEDQRDCAFVSGVLMRLGIVCLKMYDPTTRTMKFWVEKMDGGADDAAD